MTQPITENEDFVRSLNYVYQGFDSQKEDVIWGAKQAQSILEKKHEEDKEKFACEFADWIAEYTTKLDNQIHLLPHPKRKDFGPKSLKELVQIFRKENNI